MRPTIGRIVHLKVNEHEFRAATITQVFESEGYKGGFGCNMTVHLDLANDFESHRLEEIKKAGVYLHGQSAAYACSKIEGEEVGDWRWPPRAGAAS